MATDAELPDWQNGRRYWVVSPNVNNDLNSLEQWKTLIRDNKAAFMGWTAEHRLGRMFETDVRLGDVILIARGVNTNKRLVACGRVKTRALTDTERLLVPPPEGLDYGSYRLLYPFVPLDEDPEDSGLSFENVTNPGALPPAIYELRPNDQKYSNNAEFCRTLETLLGLESEETMAETELLERLVRLLRFKKQIILQGPPGTGKTRAAKRIAALMLGLKPTDVDAEERNEGPFCSLRFSASKAGTSDKGCWSLVQFHPSYNYEDFVRGIRPTAVDGQVGYSIENRIFGMFAAHAEAHPNQSFLLIIDEINRANLGAVLGELIYALEYRGVPVLTPYRAMRGSW